MRDDLFDTFVRHAPRCTSRRGALGVLAGNLLGVSISRAVSAGNKKRSKKQKAKERARECRARAGSCVRVVEAYCADLFPHSEADYFACWGAFLECCRLYRNCHDHDGDTCIANVRVIYS